MAKFRKPAAYQTAIKLPDEHPKSPAPAEKAVVEVMEAPTVKPKMCGVRGCLTWYDDPVIMDRHRLRVHGIGAKNRNKPKPIVRTKLV